jgi:hypothetical protein
MATNGITVSMDLTKFHNKIQELSKVRDAAMPAIYDEFVRNTPIDKGNARQNTSYHANVIRANYDYADVLEAGRGFRAGQMRGSEQAPNGMVEPTREFAKQLLPQLIKKAWSK